MLGDVARPMKKRKGVVNRGNDVSWRPPYGLPPSAHTRGACLLLSKMSMVSSISSGVSPASIPSSVALSSLVLTWFGLGLGYGLGLVMAWMRLSSPDAS